MKLEPLTFNPSVLGSNPRGPTKLDKIKNFYNYFHSGTAIAALLFPDWHAYSPYATLVINFTVVSTQPSPQPQRQPSAPAELRRGLEGEEDQLDVNLVAGGGNWVEQSKLSLPLFCLIK